MVSRKMLEQGQLVQELDAKIYRKIAGQLSSKQIAMKIVIEIQRKKKQDKWMIELWSKDPDKARKAIDEVLESVPVYEKTTLEAPESYEKEPLIEVSDKKDYLEVLMELAGVDKKDIELKVENVLKISVKGKEYSKVLPCYAKITSTTLKNNVLNIKLKK